jgi:hypothetical protein
VRVVFVLERQREPGQLQLVFSSADVIMHDGVAGNKINEKEQERRQMRGGRKDWLGCEKKEVPET